MTRHTEVTELIAFSHLAAYRLSRGAGRDSDLGGYRLSRGAGGDSHLDGYRLPLAKHLRKTGGECCCYIQIRMKYIKSQVVCLQIVVIIKLYFL